MGGGVGWPGHILWTKGCLEEVMGLRAEWGGENRKWGKTRVIRKEE